MVFLDCFMYFLHLRFSGVATYKPSLGPLVQRKNFKRPYLNMTFLQNPAELSKSSAFRQMAKTIHKTTNKQLCHRYLRLSFSTGNPVLACGIRVARITENTLAFIFSRCSSVRGGFRPPPPPPGLEAILLTTRPASSD